MNTLKVPKDTITQKLLSNLLGILFNYKILHLEKILNRDIKKSRIIQLYLKFYPNFYILIKKDSFK